MLPEQRQELLRRRQQLHERRERQEADERRQRFTAPLDQAGVVYALVEDEPLVAWITDRFTVDRRCSSIDWGKVAERECAAGEDSGASEWLTRLAAEKLFGDPIVAVVFADPDPSLTIRYGELVKHAETVINFNNQTWVFDPSSSWIVEFHHDRGWWWGRSA